MDKYYLTLPDFRPKYDQNLEYRYKAGSKSHENLFQLLTKTSENHCMYCFSNLKNDRGQIVGHLEHAIEKGKEDSILSECIPNIGLCCSSCNTSFKRRGEKKRKEYVAAEIKLIEKKEDCRSNKCITPCQEYLDLKKKYLSNEDAHIILQPQGVFGDITEKDLRLQYNLITAEFEPSIEYGEYSDDENQFIIDHINQFALNDEGMRTQALFDFLDDTINAGGKYNHKKGYYSNLIVDLFIEMLDEIEPENVVDYCLNLYSNYLVLHRIKI